MTTVIYGSPSKIAWMIGIPLDRLEIVAEDSEKFYRPYSKRKPNGKTRLIDRPTGELKEIQARLNKVLLVKLPLPACVVGGVKGRDPDDHLRLHVGKNVVVTLDVENCFPSITNAHIFQVYRNRVQCSPAVARLLTKLTTRIGHLPQGSPCSTTLANLMLVPVVQEIEKLAQRFGFGPSQFVDDTAMSGDRLDDRLITEVVRIFSRHGLRIGRDKIMVMRSGDAQVVIGKNVNVRPSIPSKRRKKVRSALHQLSKVPHTNSAYGRLYRSVRGRAADVARLHPDEGKRLLSQFETLRKPV